MTKNISRQLVRRVTCPNCWHEFLPEEVLFIAKHPSLVGDEIVGSSEFLRFRPKRFTLEGEAIDPKGEPTSDLACPNCHLPVNNAMLEVPGMYISIIGCPASGKSYFLATMAWELRKLLPKFFFDFNEADPEGNRALQEYEEILFMNPEPDQPTEIRRTSVTDPKLHKMIKINDTLKRFPVPMQFRLWPLESHSKYEDAHTIGRILIMYDNAGEDFLPGKDDATSAAILHLAKSQVLFMLFDPSQDVRFMEYCKKNDLYTSDTPQVDAVLRQELLLQEAARRIRNKLGLSQSERINKPLIIIVPKFDLWKGSWECPLKDNPYQQNEKSEPWKIQLDQIEQSNKMLQDIFAETCPGFLSTAKSISQNICFIPVSSLGCSPEKVKVGEYEYWAIRPRNINPQWVTVPFMYALSKFIAPDLISKA